MTGALSGNFSLDNVLKSGLTAGLTAGLTSAPLFDGESLNQMANVQTTAGNIVGNFNPDTFGQNLLGMAGRGLVNAGVNTAAYGGSFGAAFKLSLVNDLAAVGANAVGQNTNAYTPQNVLGHALVGALAAGLKGQDAVAGAIGGAGAALVNPLIDDYTSATSDTARTIQHAVSSMLVTGVLAGTLGHDPLVAAGAAQNETLNNFLTQENIKEKYARLNAVNSSEERSAIVKAFIRKSGENTSTAFKNLDASVMGVASLEAEQAKLVALIDGPTACAADAACRQEARQSIGDIEGMLNSYRAGQAVAEYAEPLLIGAEIVGALVSGGRTLLARGGFGAIGANSEGAFSYYMQQARTLNVSTSENASVFYSGTGNRFLAEQFANANGRTTLEMTSGGGWLDAQKLFSPNSLLSPAQATQVWSTLSERFAAGASGNAVGFTQGARTGSIFNTIEFPTLLKNPNVTNVLTGGH